MNEVTPIKKTLLVGIGNNGRGDDALGWKFIDVFSAFDELFDIEYRYQLQIEDADLIRRYEKVIFIDASRLPLQNGVSFYPCTPAVSTSFTTHKLDPEMVLWLAHDLYNATPLTYVMAIEGKEWELHQGLSEQGQLNFQKAISLFLDHIADVNLKIQGNTLSIYP